MTSPESRAIEVIKNHAMKIRDEISLLRRSTFRVTFPADECFDSILDEEDLENLKASLDNAIDSLDTIWN